MHTQRSGILLSVLAGLLTLAGTLALLDTWGHRPVLAREPAAAPAVALAADGIRYVALSGDDASNDCTQPLAPCRTLQHAIDQAAPGDEVRVAAGVYTDCAVRPAPPGYDGSSTVTQVAYITQSLTLRGGFTVTDWLTYNPVSYPTTLDAQQQGRVILLAGDVSVTVEGLRITGGGAVVSGGGLYALSATVVLSDNQIFDNAEGLGNGFYAQGGSVSLYRNVIAHNPGSDFVGILVDLASVTFEDNTITNYPNGGILMSGITGPVTLYGNQVVSNSGGIIIGDAIIVQGSHNRFEANVSYGGLRLENVATLMLNDNTFFNNINADWTNDQGGGLYFAAGNVTLRGNTFLANAATMGSGMYGEAQNITLVNNVIEQNYGQAPDSSEVTLFGGVWLEAGDHITLTGNRIMTNTAGYLGGGAVRARHGLLVDNLIAGNAATFADGGLGVGGGDGVMTLDGNRIVHNSAQDGSGGLWLSGGTFALNGNTIYQNSGLSGGGVFVQDSRAILTNNLIADNGAGGGLYIENSQVDLLHTTIADNWGVGVYVAQNSTAALTNTLLADHGVGISVTEGNTLTVSGVLWHNTPITIASALTAAAHVTGEVWGDPAFADPLDGDYHIRFASAAIDRGSDGGVPTDIDGDPRPYGLAPDLGADELAQFALGLTKHAVPNPVRPGGRITYTLFITNPNAIALHATLTDTFPLHVYGQSSGGTAILPGGQLVWTPTLPALGGVWSETLVVTVTPGFSGVLTNVLTLSSVEGVTASTFATTVVHANVVFLPLTLRGYSPGALSP